MHYGSGMDWGNGWGWMLAMAIGTLLVIVVVVVLVIVLIGRMNASSGSSTANQEQTNSPKAVLDLRYARGEIDTAEYEERSRNLKP